MPFESVPDDIESFFNSGGEVPDSLKSEITPPPAEDPPALESTPPVETVVETPAEPPASGKPATTAPEAPKEQVVQNPAYEAQLRQQQNTLDTLTKTLSDMLAAKKAEQDAANAPPVPDKATDPLGYLDHQIKQVADRIDALAKGQEQKSAETTQQTQIRQFIDTVNGQVQEFKKEATDYDDAYKHLVSLRLNDYTNMGYTQEQAAQLVSQEETRLAANALQQGKNPGRVAYELAKSHGYVPKAVSAPVVPPESKLDSIKKGLETSGAERGSPPPTYSTDSVKSMNDKQLTEAVTDHWEEMFGKTKSKSIF